MGNGADLFCDFSKILFLAEQDGDIVQVVMSQPNHIDGNSDINAFLFTDLSAVLSPIGKFDRFIPVS